MGLARGDDYSPPRLARLIHSVPHINATLHRVNDTFAPDSPVYLESLGILGSVPGAWLIFTLLILLIYLLTRCCDRKQRPPKSICALKVTLMILSVLCCGAIGVGLFGNDDLHNAALQSIQAGSQLALLVGNVRNQSIIIEETMGDRARASLLSIGDVLDAPVANQTALGVLLRAHSLLRSNASDATRAAGALRQPLARLQLDQACKTLWRWEAWRWAGGMAAWCAGGAVCVALLAAAARRSRRALTALAVCSLVSLVACWLAAGLLAALGVAWADACQDPAAAVARYAPHTLPPDMAHYYLSCVVSRENALTSELRNAQRAVLHVRQALATLSRDMHSMFPNPALKPALGVLNDGTRQAEHALQALGTALDCHSARVHFVAAATAACGPALQALSLQLAAAIAAGFLFTAIVLVDSHVWIYINTKREGTGSERAPFLSSSSGGSEARAPNGKPPCYSAALQMQRQDPPRVRMSGSATLGRGSSGGMGGGGGGGVGGGGGTLGAATLGRAHNGKYATLSRQCKTLEGNDFY